MGGSLDQPSGSNVKREISITDVTAFTIAQIVTNYNNNFGQNGWRIIQFIETGGKRYVLAEREL